MAAMTKCSPIKGVQEVNAPAAAPIEIAYGVEPESEGNGYATEAAQALVGYAFQCKDVLLIRAHTLPEANASTRVLTKCGFGHVGEVTDPEDGPVWRWDKQRNAS